MEINWCESYSLFNNKRHVALVFCDSNTYFAAKFLTPGFKHVHLIERFGNDWMMFHPGLERIYTNLYIETGPQFIKHYALQEPDQTFLELEIDAIPPSIPTFRPSLINCVSMVQYYLGVYWPLTLTPRALYLRLVNSPPKHIRILR